LHWYRLRASLRHCMLSSLGVVFVLAVLGWRQLTDGRMLIFRCCCCCCCCCCCDCCCCCGTCCSCC
jgi:hypothetical protein